MGGRAVPVICFGFSLGAEDDIESEEIKALIEDYRWGDDQDWPARFVSHGHFEHQHFMIAIAGTYCEGAGWGTYIDIPSLPPEEHKIQAAKIWCEEHGITWQEPVWVAMAEYG